MNDPIISIIVPVYKVEPYLRQCVDSLIHQTYPHLEIILVDDGSPDNCGKICDDYAAADSRVKVIHQENSGVAAARNRALTDADGAYVMFVDGDDWTDRDTCDLALDAAQLHEADVVMWTYLREFDGHAVKKEIFGENRVFDKPGVRELHRRFIGLIGKELAQPENADALCPVWGKLYRREVLEGAVFTDLNEIGTYEDGLFNLGVFERVDKAVYIDRPLYHYRKTNQSSQTAGHNPRLVAQWQHLFDRMEEYAAKNHLPQSYEDALYNRIALSLIGLGLNIVPADVPHAEKIRMVGRIVGNERYREAYRRLEYRYFPAHWKVFFMCAKWRFSAGVYMLLLVMRRLISR